MPLRTCIACRKKAEKARLVRLVAGGGVLRYDRDAVLEGRGAYICPDKNCLAGAYKKGAFQRAIKTKAGLPDIDALWVEIEDGSKSNKTTRAADKTAPASKGG
ncbi:MAG: YlxR family protein [Deltaproteobacteria bacterium]|nr:YlxR family protein [Deltaproteobacteria bacterium]